jgi:CRP-like cAMP-binding protein
MSEPHIDLASVLQRAPLLSSLSAAELQLLAARTARKSFGNGQLLFSEGDPCNGLHIIARGKSVLVKLAQAEGKQCDRGIEFQLPATHQELAHQLGTVRELISRNLMRLLAEGQIDVDARQIVVKNMKELSASRGRKLASAHTRSKRESKR